MEEEKEDIGGGGEGGGGGGGRVGGEGKGILIVMTSLEAKFTEHSITNFKFFLFFSKPLRLLGN